MNIKKAKLQNKLETVIINSKGALAATVQIWFRAGSALEASSDKGIAHFLEHMFFKGTSKRPGANIAKEVESFGGEINAFTSFDYTCYYINCPNGKLAQATHILLDMVTNPTFAQDDLVPERGVVFEEYRRSLDSPNQYMFMKLQESSFPKQYATPILGTEKSIKTFSRDQLINFRNKYYNNQNALLVVAGDIKDSDSLTNQITQYHLPDGNKSNFTTFKLRGHDAIEIHHKEVKQASITIAVECPGYDSYQSASEDLAINCLAHGETSRLYEQLVLVTKSCHSINGSTMFFAKGGIHFLKLTFLPRNFRKVLSDLKNIIQNILDLGFTEKEIKKIKNQYIASKVYERESLEYFAFSLGHGFAQNGDIHCEEEFIGRIKLVSSSQVNKSISEIFKRNIHVSLQLPVGEQKNHYQADLVRFVGSIKKLKPKKSLIKTKTQVSLYDVNAREYIFENGIKLVYRKNSIAPTFVLQSYIKGGGSEEPRNQVGIYSLLSRAITYGHKDCNYNDLKSYLDYVSASMYGFCGKNAYGIHMHGQSEHFEMLCEHFFKTLTFPSFKSNYLTLEKNLIKQEVKNQSENPVKICFNEFQKLIFHKHPYARSLIDQKKPLNGITASKIKNLHSNSLLKKEIVITYCGDFNFEYVVEKIKDYIVHLPSRKNQKTQKNLLQPILGKSVYRMFQREQTQIFIGTKGFGYTKKEDSYLKVFTAFLSGQASELFVVVRDQLGLCYVVQPVHHSVLEAGYWGIFIGTGPDKKELALNAIQEIIKKYQKYGLSEEEFKTVKMSIEGQNEINLQTNEDFANFYSISSLHNLGIDFEYKKNEFIKNLKHQEFNKFLKSFLNKKFNIIEVGPN